MLPRVLEQMSKELKLRVISGIVLAIVVLTLTWFGGLYFSMLAQIIALLIYYEWATMTKIASEDGRAYAIGWILLGLVALGFFASGMSVALLLLLGTIVLSGIFAAIGKSSVWLPVGIAYAGFSGLSMASIRGDDFAGLVAMIYIFAIVWGTDIAAYFVGRAVGGPKLAPSISPGKTWSGAIGGAVVAVLAASAVLLAFFKSIGPGLLLAALLLSVLSQLGDLFESHIKRRSGVKDSSHLIPGHGGVMDRVDGLVFACFGAFILGLFQLLMSGEGGPSLGARLLNF
jgi:phosphatidate cytidylyltransferase